MCDLVVGVGSSTDFYADFGSSCYYGYNPQVGVVRSEAQEACAAVTPTGHLVLIESSEENAFVLSLMIEALSSASPSSIVDEDYWIGLHYDQDGDTWVWENSQVLLSGFWASGEPNGGGDDRCVEIDGSDALWNDVDCSSAVRPFICEVSVASSAPTSSSAIFRNSDDDSVAVTPEPTDAPTEPPTPEPSNAPTVATKNTPAPTARVDDDCIFDTCATAALDDLGVTTTADIHQLCGDALSSTDGTNGVGSNPLIYNNKCSAFCGGGTTVSQEATNVTAECVGEGTITVGMNASVQLSSSSPSFAVDNLTVDIVKLAIQQATNDSLIDVEDIRSCVIREPADRRRRRLLQASSSTGCNTNEWSDIDNNVVCGECSALVNIENYGSCMAFCAAQEGGLVCSGAWEELDETCTVSYELACADDDLGFTSDILCQCQLPVVVVIDIVVVVDNVEQAEEGGAVVAAFTSSVVDGSLVYQLATLTDSSLVNLTSTFEVEPAVVFTWTSTTIELCFDGETCWAIALTAAPTMMVAPSGGDKDASFFSASVAAACAWVGFVSLMLYIRFRRRRGRKTRNDSNRHDDDDNISLHLATQQLLAAAAAAAAQRRLEHEHWKIDPSSLRLLKKIAAGSGGVVYAGKFGTQDVAVKEMENKALSAAVVASFENEAGLLQQLNHPSIVHFYGLCRAANSLFLVMEFVPRNLRNFLKDDVGCPRGAETFCRLATMLADGMDFVHSSGICHRDLKPENILVDSKGRTKICDLGISRLQSATALCTTKGIGTPRYMPPESLRSESDFEESGYDGRKWDVWSLGVIFFEIWSRLPPYPGLNAMQIMFAVSERDRKPAPPWPPTHSANANNAPPPEALANLMESMWRTDPHQRPTMSEIAARLREKIAGSISGEDRHQKQCVNNKKGGIHFPSSVELIVDGHPGFIELANVG